MAIISGMEAAKVDDIKPFELPVDYMAKGIEAKQKRADDAKKNYGLGATSLIFDTRNHVEDKEMMNQISNEYAEEIEKELASRGGDWSNMDNSTIQAIAMNKFKDPRVIHLRTAKMQADAFAKEKAEREKEGFPLLFGLDPTTVSLYQDKDKTRETNFYDYSVQKQLDYHKKIDEIFKNTAKSTQEWDEFLMNNKPKGKALTPEEENSLWFMWLTTVHHKKENNYKQMQALIDNGVETFITTPEGTQMWNKEFQMYNRLNKNKPEYQNNPDKLKEDAESHAYRTIWNTMNAVAGSYKLSNIEQKMSINPIMKPQAPSDGGGGRGRAAGGDGDKEKEVRPPDAAVGLLEVTMEGTYQTVSDYQVAINSKINNNPSQIQSIVNTAPVETVKSINGLNGIENIYARMELATAVPNNSNGTDGNANQNKWGVLIGDVGYNNASGVPNLNPNVVVKGQTPSYSRNDYFMMSGLDEQTFNNLYGSIYGKLQLNNGVNNLVTNNIINNKVCFDDADLRLYYSKNNKIKDKNGNERVMTQLEVDEAINKLTGGNANQKGGEFGTMFQMNVNVEDGIVIDSDNNPETPELIVTTIAVKNEYKGLIEQYDQQLKNIEKNNPNYANNELYKSIQAKRDNLQSKVYETEFKIDMVEVNNIEDPTKRSTREEELKEKYGANYSIYHKNLVKSPQAFNEYAQNIHKLKKGIEASVYEAANLRGIQLSALEKMGVDVSWDNVRQWKGSNKTLTVKQFKRDANGNIMLDENRNPIVETNATQIPQDKMYQILFGNDEKSNNDRQKVSQSVRYAESEALDAANGGVSAAVNILNLENEINNNENWILRAGKYVYTGGYSELDNLLQASPEERKKMANNIGFKLKNLYKDITFQRFDFSTINKEYKDKGLGSSSTFSIDLTDIDNLIDNLPKSESFIKQLKEIYNFSEEEINVLTTSHQFYGLLTQSLRHNVKLDKPGETFKYTKPLTDVTNTYQKVYNEKLPKTVQGVSDETTRLLVEYQLNLQNVKKDYNKNIATYIPLVSLDMSENQGGHEAKLFRNVFTEQLSRMRGGTDSGNFPNNRLKRVRYNNESGELAVENIDLALLESELLNKWNADNPDKKRTNYTLDNYFQDDKNFRNMRFAFDGNNDDPTRPINAVFELETIDSNGNLKTTQIEMPMELSEPIMSSLGLPIDKTRLFQPLTASLQQSQGLSFTLPAISGNQQHTDKSSVKYFVVPLATTIAGTPLEKGDIILVDNGSLDTSYDDVVTGRKKINPKNPYDPNSGLAIFKTHDAAIQHHITSGLDPKRVQILNSFDKVRSEFFGVLGGSLANDQNSRVKNYHLMKNRYGINQVTEWFGLTEEQLQKTGIGKTEFDNARRTILSNGFAAPIQNTPVSEAYPKSNSTVIGQTAIVEPISVKDLSQSPTYYKDVEQMSNNLIVSEDYIDNQKKPSKKHSLKSDIKQEQLNVMPNNDLVKFLANDKIFKNSKSILDEMNKGVIRVDANGNSSNSPNFNPKTAGRYFINGNNPQYKDPKVYTNINTAKGVKPIYSEDLHRGITNINDLFNTIPELKGQRINIGSGARSIEDNIVTYSNQKNLQNLTKSNHSSFNAIDISTNVNDADNIKGGEANLKMSNAGNKLFDWFKTKDGQRFLYMNDLYIFHHKQKGSSDNTYHMHLEYSPKKSGKITDEADGYVHGNTKQYEYVPTKEDIQLKASIKRK